MDITDRDGGIMSISDMTEIRADNTISWSLLLLFVDCSRNPLARDDTDPSSTQPLFRRHNVTDDGLVSGLVFVSTFLLFGGMFSIEAWESQRLIMIS